MKRHAIRVAWVMVLLLAVPWPFATALEKRVVLGVATGDVKSTAYQIGRDVSALVKPHDIDLTVFHSHGSVENIVAVYQRSANQLGLVQSDVLAFVAKVDTDPKLRLIANKVKWVLPLYQQEIHILAKGSIHAFGDLQGRRVAIGHVQGGTYLTSRLLFEVSGVQPREIVTWDDGQALASLRDGRIDAMISVDGFPIQGLTLDVSPADGLHLVPITHDAIRRYYPASRIPAGTYAWQKTDVPTVSVRTVLVAYDFRNHYCNSVGKLAWLIRENMDWLRRNGHPKWKTVNLDEAVKGWEAYSCVRNYAPPPLQRPSDHSPAREPNPVAEAIQTVFGP